MSSMIGTGFLTLNNIIYDNGLILGSLIIILSGLTSMYGSIILSTILDQFPNNNNYCLLVGKIFNKKYRIIINIVLFLYVTCSATTYFKIIQLIFSNIGSKYNIENLQKKYVLNLIVVGFGILSYLLSLGNMDLIKKISKYANLSSVFVCLIIVIEMVPFYNYNYLKLKEYNVFEYFKWNTRIFRNFGLGLFSFTNQFVIISILSSSKIINKYGSRSVVMRSYMLPILIFTIITFCGSISIYSEKGVEIMINRSRLNYSKDILMTIGQITVILNLILGTAIRIQVNVEYLKSIKNLFKKNVCEKNFKITKKEKLLIGLLAVTICVVICILLNSIISFLHIVASFLCPIFMFIFPLLLLLKANKINENIKLSLFDKIFNTIICSFFTICCLYAFISSLIKS